jgi:hypothetical protein
VCFRRGIAVELDGDLGVEEKEGFKCGLIGIELNDEEDFEF